MKRWGWLAILLYGICMLGIFLLGFMLWEGMEFFRDFKDSRGLLFFFALTVLLPLLLGAVGLLLVPVRMEGGRPLGQRSILTAALLGSLPMGVLLLGFVLSLGLLIWGEARGGTLLYSWPVLILPLLFWLFWGTLFYRHLSQKNPEAFLSWATSWLLRGSILEVLVALISHVVARHRQECCAPFFTYCAIVAGLSVALLSFGPGLFFLFLRKIREKRGKLK